MSYLHKLSIAFCIVCIGSNQFVASNLQKEMTVSIEPGRIECFYEVVKTSQVIDLEYQVIDGGHGDLDISFQLQNPDGFTIVQDYKKSDNIHRQAAQTDGDHRFCFDNSFSSFNRKTVFFEIIIEDEGDQKLNDDNEWGRDILDGLTPDEVVDIKIQDIQDSIHNLHNDLNKLKHDLDVRRSVEARDRNVAEENNFRVTSWSFFQICLMILVGGIQVFMVRSLFETDPRANIWKKFKIFK